MRCEGVTDNIAKNKNNEPSSNFGCADLCSYHQIIIGKSTNQPLLYFLHLWLKDTYNLGFLALVGN